MLDKNQNANELAAAMKTINLAATSRWVIKVGSSLVTNNGSNLDITAMRQWADELSKVRELRKELVLVSSGSVAEGMRRLKWQTRPHELHKLQAAAAVGQMGLVQAYESCFQTHGIHTAQVLLTHEEVKNRRQYLNAKNTLRTLLDLEVLPVINENDTIATDEICFGDNDNLAAMVANIISADLLIILTDQAGLFDKNPNEFNDANLVKIINANDTSVDAMAGGSASQLGRGGMITKIQAARRAARSGTITIIASGREKGVLQRIAQGENVGTILLPDKKPLAARKQWLASQLRIKGKLVIDDGAIEVLKEQGRSLLPVGVVEVHGQFNRGDLVNCVSSQGNEIARGLINYSAEETRKIIGEATGNIEAILGYIDKPELIHRDDLVLL